jgi:ABC-2 type transport system ATP-binding protein
VAVLAAHPGRHLAAEALVVERDGQPVLQGISFAVAPGEVFALLGGNGAGKSTCLLSFLGFLPPASGSLWVLGESVAQNPAQARRAMAYLPESAQLYEHLNALENLQYFLQLAGVPLPSAAFDEALDQVALAPSARRQPLARYSKGMRQKVAIALAILRDSPILLLDEPTSGLDPQAIDEFHALVRQLADGGKTLLMVTHDLYGACQVADRIGLLAQGRLVGQFAAPEAGRIDSQQVHAAFVAAAGAPSCPQP